LGVIDFSWGSISEDLKSLGLLAVQVQVLFRAMPGGLGLFDFKPPSFPLQSSEKAKAFPFGFHRKI